MQGGAACGLQLLHQGSPFSSEREQNLANQLQQGLLFLSAAGIHKIVSNMQF
jgi:hypothetical protein